MRQAAKEVGISRSNLQRYMADGHLPDGRPIWPNQVSEQMKKKPVDAAQDWPTRAEGGSLNGSSTNMPQQGKQAPEPLSDQRDSLGRFLPGNRIGANYLSSARKAKTMLADFAPYVAETLMNIFRDLPIDRPELILAYAKEILDRGLGKPTQNVQVNEERVGAEYKFFQAVICNGDEQTIREVQALAVRMESYARDNGGASVGRQMEVVPPPGGTLNFANSRRDGQVSEANNLDASAAWQE